MFGDNNERKTLKGWKIRSSACDQDKTFLLGPQEFSKNMRKRQILIGLFVSYNNRTIGETKITQVGRERTFVYMHYLRPVYEIQWSSRTTGLGVNGFIFVFFSFGNMDVVPCDYQIVKN